MSTTKNEQAAKIQLGKTGPQVFPIGLGCMGMGKTGAYGASDDSESVAAIQHAIDRGVTLIDTGDFYGQGHNELLVREAIKGRRDRVQLSVKFGGMRGPDGSFIGIDARPAAVKNFIAYSLVRLGVDCIDIYRPARLDPAVPIEDTIGAIADLVKAGYVRHIGLSEVGAETIERAVKVHPICDLQIEYALATRSAEEQIFPTLHKHGISATLYGVFSRGLLTGSKPKGAGDFRAHLPRFSGENQAQNYDLVDKLHDFAKSRGMTPAQLAIAWVRAKEPAFLPLPGPRTIKQIDDVIDALSHALSHADLQELDRLMPPESIRGTRYGAEQMKMLDSEK